MPDDQDPPASEDYAVIFDAEAGFQVLNIETSEVADLALLQGTWRERGAPVPETSRSDASEPEPQPGEVTGDNSDVTGLTTLQYGGLRLRSVGVNAYDIKSSAIGGVNPPVK